MDFGLKGVHVLVTGHPRVCFYQITANLILPAQGRAAALGWRP